MRSASNTKEKKIDYKGKKKTTIMYNEFSDEFSRIHENLLWIIIIEEYLE